MNWNDSYVATILNTAYNDFKLSFPDEEPYWRINCLRRRTPKWHSIADTKENWRSEEKPQTFATTSVSSGQLHQREIPVHKTNKRTMTRQKVTQTRKVQSRTTGLEHFIEVPISDSVNITEEEVFIPLICAGHFSLVRRDELPEEIEVIVEEKSIQGLKFEVWPGPHQLEEIKDRAILVDSLETQLNNKARMEKTEKLQSSFKLLSEKFEILKNSFVELSNIKLDFQLKSTIQLLEQDLIKKINSITENNVQLEMKKAKSKIQEKWDDVNKLAALRKSELLAEREVLNDSHKILAETQHKLVLEAKRLDQVEVDNKSILESLEQINTMLGKSYSVVDILSKYRDTQKKLSESKSLLIPKLIEFKDVDYVTIMKEHGYIMSIPIIFEKLIEYLDDPDDYDID